MPRFVLPTYTVIRDTREQSGHGWVFNAHLPERRPPNCDGMVIDTLRTGDYSLVGYTDVLAIERKANFAELWGNYSSKKRIAFEAEMERMSEIKYAYLIVESCLSSDIMELSPPQFTKGVPGKSLIRWLLFITSKYNVNFIPAGSCGIKVAQMIFEEVVRLEKDRWVPQIQNKKTKGDCFGL